MSKEKNIPLPPRNRGKVTLQGELAALEVGESFVMRNPHNYDLMTLQNRALSGGYVQRPKKFATRRMVEKGKHIVRVWRIG